MTELSLLLAALLAGAAGSIHCVAMCGALCGSMGMACTQHGGQQSMALAQLHLGRIAGYAALGALLSGVGGSLLSYAPAASARSAVQFATGVAMLLLGLRLILGAQPFAWLEAPGRRLWPHLARLSRPLVPAHTAHQRLALGALWSALPCGLLYSVLMVASLRADAAEGAMIMLAFGLGTTPALYGSGQFARAGLRNGNPVLFKLAAVFVCALGGLSVLLALMPGAMATLHPMIGLDCLP